LGGFEVPVDERVGGDEATDRELAFTTFAAAQAAEPQIGGLVAALATGRLTL
jgi:hypothetical protein